MKLNSDQNQNCILRTLNIQLRNETENNQNTVNWEGKIKSLLQHSGFPDIWLFPESVDVNKFIPVLSLRLRDIYLSEWRGGMALCTSLAIYREMKTTFELTPYLKGITNRKFRNMISKLRLSSHPLAIETSRHRNIERAERKCVLCNDNDIEDEFHFILICPRYNDLRKTHIARYYYRYPSVAKLIELLNTTNLKTLNKLAVYAIKALKRREGLLAAN